MLVRHRLAFLLTVLALSVTLGALRPARIPVVSGVSVTLLFTLWLALAVSAILTLNSRQPETFGLRDGAFTTPPPPSAILTAAALPAMFAAFLSEYAYESGRGWSLGSLPLIALGFLQWRVILGRYGLSLHPDGLRDRQPLGTLFIPWEAIPTAEPTRYGVRVRTTRPDLQVRKGFHPGALVRTGADRGFAAWTINLYAARPDLRPTIGTLAGLDHLRPGITPGRVPEFPHATEPSHPA